MPRPRSERHAWEDERAEIPAQIAALERDLDATPIENTPRRDRLTWTRRRARLRMAEFDTRLAREDLPRGARREGLRVAARGVRGAPVVGPVILVQIDRAQCATLSTASAVQRCRALIPALGFVPTAIGLVILAFAILLLAVRRPGARTTTATTTTPTTRSGPRFRFSVSVAER